MSGQPVGDAAGSGRTVCTACPLLCDDIVRGASRPRWACDVGAAAFAAADREAAAGLPQAAIAHAAAVAAAARRVLVTGLTSGTNESILAACDLAESLGAAVDAGVAETARIAGPTIARSGAVTADWEELRDRADLVLFWFCDPTSSHPRFLERFVLPPMATGRKRRTIAVGPAAVLPPGPLHTHCTLPRDAAVTVARLLEAAGAGIDPGPVAADHEATANLLAAALSAAGSVALVTAHADDAVGVEAWAVAGLVRRLAHDRPAFAIPLGPGIHSPDANAAGAAAIITWRYGAAGAIARADRHGGEFLPAEADARRLVSRGEVDCLIAVGPLPARLDAAIAARPDLAVIRIADAAGLAAAPRTPNAVEIRLPCASLLREPCGGMLRGDGRRLALGRATGGSESMASILAVLLDRVRERTATGGRA